MCNRLSQFTPLFACVSFTLVLISCETGQEIQGVLGTTGDVSAGVVSVHPAAASPGTTVRVEASEPVFEKEGYAKVRIGEQAGQIVRWISDVAVDVLVPRVAPGITPVQILEPDLPAGPAGRLKVLPAKSLQLLLSLSDQRFELLNTRPGGTHPRRGTDPGGRRIQYEVYNELGRLVFTDVLTHPTLGRHEVFDEPDSGERTMHRLAERDEATFAIVVPNVPGGVTIHFYEVPEGARQTRPGGGETGNSSAPWK